MDSPTRRKKAEYPPVTIAKARLMYVYHGTPTSEIAKEIGATTSVVSYWVKSRDWVRERETLVASASREAEQKAHSSLIKDTLDLAATRAASLTLASLDLAETNLQDGNAKNLMYAASSAKTLADMARQSSQSSQPSFSLTLDLNSLPRANISPETLTLPQPQTLLT